MLLEQIKDVLDGEDIIVNVPYIEWEKKVADNAIKYVKDNGLTNLCIAVEEMAELQQTITKMVRGKGDKAFVTEELADVYLGMRFINKVYNVNIDIDKHIYPSLDEVDFIKMHTDKYSIYEILKAINTFQGVVLDAIIYQNTKNLESKGNDLIDALESLKILYDISNKDVYKIRNYKVHRLSERIINKTKI